MLCRARHHQLQQQQQRGGTSSRCVHCNAQHMLRRSVCAVESARDLAGLRGFVGAHANISSAVARQAGAARDDRVGRAVGGLEFVPAGFAVGHAGWVVDDATVLSLTKPLVELQGCIKLHIFVCKTCGFTSSV